MKTNDNYVGKNMMFLFTRNNQIILRAKGYPCAPSCSEMYKISTEHVNYPPWGWILKMSGCRAHSTETVMMSRYKVDFEPRRVAFFCLRVCFK